VCVCFYGGFSWLHGLWWFFMRSDDHSHHSHHSLKNHILSRFPEAFEAEVVLQSARCFCRCFGPIVMDLIELFLWSEVGPPAPSGLRVFKVGGFSKVTTFQLGPSHVLTV
jgi:hypothetical protein